MRPSILFPLFAEIRTLSGVGPKLEKLIQKVAGPRLVDLVFDLPVGVVDRSYQPRLAAAEPGRIATVAVTVLEHRPGRVKSQPYKVMVSDDTSMMELVFFRAHADYLAKQLPVGEKRVLSGRIERFKDRLQMTHPDYIVAPEARAELLLSEGDGGAAGEALRRAAEGYAAAGQLRSERRARAALARLERVQLNA